MARRTILAWMTVLLVSGCAAGQPAGTGAEKKDASPVAEGDNQFALQLYQALRGNEGNLFFSPYSISTALAMTYAGARGDTQQQMAQVLHLPSMTQEQLAQAFGEIIKDLNKRGGGGKYELRVANALWGQQGYKFLPAFTELVEKQYGGMLRTVDFVTAAEQARQTINAWVDRQTNGKIKDLIGPGVLNAMTRLVLTNAIYFKGNWASQFEKDRTRDQPFTLVDGKQVQVPMMNQQARFGYAETDALQALEIPYVGDELSMVVLLPRKTDGIKELQEQLTGENLSKWLGQIGKREVIVWMPKFKMTDKFDLSKTLQSMGMTDAFTQRADFSGMAGNRDLLISAVIHQAYVDINEEGTEAAAATGVTVSLTSVGPQTTPVFRADHPFLFLIRDKPSGSILFLGRAMNPQGS
jgi:serpin B